MKLALLKEHTGRRLTFLGWLVTLILIAAVFIGFTASLYPFLAPDAPPHKGLLVVEGWIHDFALDEAVTIYRTGDYSKIICTGVPIETGSYIQAFKSYPEMTRARLLDMGVDPSEIIIAIGEETNKDRTYVAATALREAFMAYNIDETNIHLITTGPHGRRSRLLFQKALGKDYHVGITCLEDSGYDPDHWYIYSQGVRKVIGEWIAYTYAKLFFHP
jgi:uncharacterized SAM-binding protein YcdF (DUF218 family)